MDTTTICAEIQTLWGDALGVDVEPEDDFFDLGGNSITAIRMLPVLTEKFGVEPTVAVVFDNPTPQELARAVAELRGTA
jgi:phthiocerol/phenolphthiocerol synthesis type-I polyketide synthase E